MLGDLHIRKAPEIQLKDLSFESGQLAFQSQQPFTAVFSVDEHIFRIVTPDRQLLHSGVRQISLNRDVVIQRRVLIPTGRAHRRIQTAADTV